MVVASDADAGSTKYLQYVLETKPVATAENVNHSVVGMI